jgi:hypothetical protein
MMNSEGVFFVITTINAPTDCTKRFSAKLRDYDVPIIVVGDKNGPPEYNLNGAMLLSLQDQMKLPYSISRILPLSHYARKNLGYLEAIRQGAGCIYETDDDNAPRPSWKVRERAISCAVAPERKWMNVYQVFSGGLVWPRGFPLEQIREQWNVWKPSNELLIKIEAPIQQGLTNLSPDVDSIWRLVLDKVVRFDDLPSIHLQPGTWCPFNSQSTWWWKDAFHLMYLPSYCSFRMTDIWRSFVAQRCLWAMGSGIVFHSAEVEQERNPHNLHADFCDEVSGFLSNQRIVDILSDLDLPSGHESNCEAMANCYKALVREGIFPDKEIALVNAWIDDLNMLTSR